MAKNLRKQRKSMRPFYSGGVVALRVPEGTPEREKANAVAVMKQMAYDFSDHPTIWGNNSYKRRKYGTQSQLW